MTTRTITLAALALLAFGPAAVGAAHSQTALKLEGQCERLVIAGKDVTASCTDTLTNAVARSRATFEFTTKDGRSLTFGGNGFQQDRTEETDPLQPISFVLSGERSAEGVRQDTVMAVGQCSFATPEPGRTAIRCEAESPTKGAFAGTFVTMTKDATAKGEGEGRP